KCKAITPHQPKPEARNEPTQTSNEGVEAWLLLRGGEDSARPTFEQCFHKDFHFALFFACLAAGNLYSANRELASSRRGKRAPLEVDADHAGVTREEDETKN